MPTPKVFQDVRPSTRWGTYTIGSDGLLESVTCGRCSEHLGLFDKEGFTITLATDSGWRHTSPVIGADCCRCGARC